MSEKRKTIDLSDNCRVCLGKNDRMADLYFSNTLKKINEAVNNSATIHVDESTNNGLPQKICYPCLHRLEEWCDFKSQFIKTNKYLDGVLDPKKLKLDVEKPNLETKTNVDNTSTTNQDDEKPPKALINDFKMDFDCTSGSQMLVTSTPTTTTTKLRQIETRNTNKQRLLSTQCQKARKESLGTDSDSIATDDDTKLSPIKKARSNKSNIIQQKDADYNKNTSPILNDKDLLINTTTTSPINNKKIDDFEESTEELQLIIGDETFIITTMLPKINSQFINEIMTNDDLPILIESNENDEENGDIFDDIKLRRLKPNDYFSFKNCLTLKIAANDIESLKRIQTVVHKYIDNDLKKKLLNNSSDNNFLNDIKHSQDSFQSLELKLKTLIDNSVIKNVNKSDTNSSIDNNAIKFIKAAEESPMFQPVVRLYRLELPKNDISPINNETIDTNNTTNIIENIKIDNNHDSELNSPQLKSITPNKSPSLFNKSINDFSLNDYSYLSDEDRHVCGDCGAVFATQEEVELHFDEHKNELRQVFKRCSRCKVLVENDLVKSHICLKICTICNETFKTKKKLDIHMKKHEDTRLNTIMENNSNNNNEIVEDISEKIDSTIEIKNKHSCYVCDKIFCNYINLSHHLQEHVDNTTERLESILGDDTDKSITTKTIYPDVKSLINQVEIEKEEKKETKIETVQCGMCPYKIPIGIKENHVKEHINQEGVDDIDIGDEENIDNKTIINNNQYILYDCVQCTDKFTTEDELTIHIQTHDDGDTTYVDWDDNYSKKDDKHACTVCDMSFNNEKTLSEHFDTHCNEMYTDNYNDNVEIVGDVGDDNNDGNGEDDNDDNSKSFYCLLCDDETLLNAKELELHVDQHINEGL